MTIILCLDDENGFMFNRRRQSRDREVLADVAALSKETTLRVAPYSAPLFAGMCEPQVSDDFLEAAAAGDVCFAEDRDVTPFLPKAQRIVLYRWNRRYPADVRFDTALLDAFRLTERTDFPGYSHESITREVYDR